MSELFLHSKLDNPPHEIKDVHSSVLGDRFLFIDRAKVLMHHSFKKIALLLLDKLFFLESSYSY